MVRHMAQFTVSGWFQTGSNPRAVRFDTHSGVLLPLILYYVLFSFSLLCVCVWEGCQWCKQWMSPVSGGITLKLSHAYRPRRAFLNQWTGLEQPFQHTLRQGHLTEIQVGGRATRRGAARRRWGVGGCMRVPSSLYLVKMCPFIITVYPCASVRTYLCSPALEKTHIQYYPLSDILGWFVWKGFKVPLRDQNWVHSGKGDVEHAERAARASIRGLLRPSTLSFLISTRGSNHSGWPRTPS